MKKIGGGLPVTVQDSFITETEKGNIFAIQAQLMSHFLYKGTLNVTDEMATPHSPCREVVCRLWAQVRTRDFSGSKL